MVKINCDKIEVSDEEQAELRKLFLALPTMDKIMGLMLNYKGLVFQVNNIGYDLNTGVKIFNINQITTKRVIKGVK